MKHAERQELFKSVGQALGYALVIAAQHPPGTPEAAGALKLHLSKAALDPATDAEVSTLLMGVIDALGMAGIAPH